MEKNNLIRFVMCFHKYEVNRANLFFSITKTMKGAFFRNAPFFILLPT